MQELSTVDQVNTVINRELTKETASALLATTFKGLDQVKMKQALMEGMIRGFEFKDFLQKNIYALPFGTGYSLVTSIDYSRKIAMRSGLAGKSAPSYTFNEDKSIETCSVTVKRNVDGITGDYTATVYFKEYTTNRNLWVSKPMTMIAKVAEMHALRMAFPEEMSQQYVEEELEMETNRTSRISEIKTVENGGLNMGSFKKTNDETKTNEEVYAADAAADAGGPEKAG